MDKKKILLGLGLITLIGGAYYFYNKNKSSDTVKSGDESVDDTSSKDKMTSVNENKATDIAKKALTSKKEKKKACGRRPLNKNKRTEWQKCVDAGGISGFEGDFDSFQNDYIDFEGQVSNQFMFSEFESNLDLDL